MSFQAPARWLLGAIEKPQCQQLCRSRQFHFTACLQKRDRGRLGSKPKGTDKSKGRGAAQERKLRRQFDHSRGAFEAKRGQVDNLIERRAKQIRRYSPEQLKALSQIYTPQQIEAMMEAEQAIDPQDLISQGRMRTDPAALPYLDDLASIDPVLDKLRQGPEIKYGLSTPDEREKGFQKDAEARLSRTKKSSDKGKKLTAAQQRLAEADEDPHLLRLMQKTGLSEKDISKLRVKTLATRRVVNQTRIGKVMSQYSLVVAGNGNGLLGLGEGKAAEFADAQRQAMMEAIKKMRPVHRYESRTIYGDVRAKVGAVEIELNSRPPGFGVRTQHLIFEMARIAGITDLAGKCLRSHNPMNVCKATFQALLSQKLPEDIARARGLKMVDVRKVYYAGRTL